MYKRKGSYRSLTVAALFCRGSVLSRLCLEEAHIFFMIDITGEHKVLPMKSPPKAEVVRRACRQDRLMAGRMGLEPVERVTVSVGFLREVAALVSIP